MSGDAKGQDSGGEEQDVRMWAEPGGPIMLKAITAHGDPVELNEHEARLVIRRLSALIAQIAED